MAKEKKKWITIVVIILTINVAIGIGVGIFTEINLDRKEVEMPNVVGMSKEDAQKEIENAKLKFEVEKEEYNKDVQEGYVISQDPNYMERFNKMKKGTTVSVIISKGKEETTVPNVKGKEKEEAIKLIEEANLKVQIIEETNKTVKEGYVISQETDPNEEVFAGDTIIIHISTEKNESTIEEKQQVSQENSALSPDNVEIEKEINTLSDANKSTQFILSLVWNTYADTMPNAKWVTFEIKEADGYGRFWVYLKYLKNTSETYYSYAHHIVWWVDDNHFGKYWTTGDIWAQKSQSKWGTKIDLTNQ